MDRVKRRRGAWVRALVVVCGLACAARGAQPVSPVVAGYHRLKDDARAIDAAGELLLAELNCTTCHRPEGDTATQRLAPKGAPNLSDVGARVTPQWVRAYLSDPHAIKPGATMPDVLHGTAPAEREAAVESLTHFLLSLGGPIRPSTKGGNVLLVEQGRTLYHTVGCVACHAPERSKGEAPAMPKVPSVPLGEFASKTTVDQLAQFLLDPLKARPHGRMPASNLTPDEAEALAVYLLREQMDNPQSEYAEPAKSRGVKFAYYEGGFTNVPIDRFERHPVRAEGKADKFTIDVPQRTSGENFAFKFTAAIRIPRDGKYTFYTRSDDGSRLYLGGKQLIDNDGTHGEQEKSASVELTAGEHPIVVTFFEGGGGETLRVEWQGPGIDRQEIPSDALLSIGGRAMVPLRNETLAVDPQKAEAGKQLFASLGCASCHALNGVEPAKAAPALADLKSEAGCLSDKVPNGLPQFHLSESQRAAMGAALKDRAALASILEPAARITRTMAALNCYACHERGGVGGADGSRIEHFVMTASFDMGDEGKLPPRLSGVGAKLKPEAMEKVIAAGELHVRRHHMATRMPRFTREHAKALAGDFVKVDDAGAPAISPSPFTELIARDGRLLIGTKGMGCVNCHGVGDAKSLGMPSVNLSAMYERLQWPWFRQLLLDPAKVNPGTRMPGFWTDGHIVYKDIAGGTADGQIGAIWAYLSLGAAMPLPAGVRPEGVGLELVPVDEPIVHRTFMAELGARAIAVGFPDGLHVAFDANAVRLAKSWRGRFFDAKGMWEGRGGAAYGPLGRDVLNLSAGPAVAVLGAPDADWPVPRDRRQRDVGGQFKGYRLDEQRQPIFLYRLGDVDIEEQPVPELRPGGPILMRKFSVTGKPPAAGALYFLAAAGAKVQEQSPGTWRVDDKLTVRLRAPAGVEAVVRERGAVKQLVMPIPLREGSETVFDVEMAW